MLRYRFGVEAITRWFVVGVVIDTADILALGIWDFAVTGAISGYTLFIAALIGYSLTYGKGDVRRLDRWMAAKLRPRRPVGC